MTDANGKRLRILYADHGVVVQPGSLVPPPWEASVGTETPRGSAVLPQLQVAASHAVYSIRIAGP